MCSRLESSRGVVLLNQKSAMPLSKGKPVLLSHTCVGSCIDRCNCHTATAISPEMWISSCPVSAQVGQTSSPEYADSHGLLGSHSFIILHKHSCHHLMTSNHSPQHNPTTSIPQHQCRICQQCQDPSTHSILVRFAVESTCPVSSSVAILHT